MRHFPLLALSPLFVPLWLSGACASEPVEDEDDGSTSGQGGATAASSNASTGATASTATNVSSAASTGAGPSDPMIACALTDPHLLISEVALGNDAAELVEIYNPSAAAVDLSNIYLSDNSTYYRIAAGQPFAPITSNPGTDYLVRFPLGASLGPGELATVQLGTNFHAAYGVCPDYILFQPATPIQCEGQPIAAMAVPVNGDPGTELGGMVSNAGESVVLFCWDGSSATVEDIDYVTWDDMFDTPDGTHVDKTGQAGYAADTAPMSQSLAPRPAVPQNGAVSLSRCSGDETGETEAGGNGLLGHDETSEDMATTFVAFSTEDGDGPNPGVLPTCE